MLSFGQNVHKGTSHVFIGHFPFSFTNSPDLLPHSVVCLPIKPWFEPQKLLRNYTLTLGSHLLSPSKGSFSNASESVFLSFSNTETIWEEERSSVPLCSKCHQQNDTPGATHHTNREGTHLSQCQMHFTVD